jgi:TupA-like ATPgrasp
MLMKSDGVNPPSKIKPAKPLRHLVAGLAARMFARGIRQRTLAHRIAYPFVTRDEAAARWRHRSYHGVAANLGAPQGLDEKICWLKIHDRRPLLSRMACKFEAREIVHEAGYGHLLKELHGVWDRPEDIDFDALPDRFALKSTHGTKQNYFHENGQAPDRDALRDMARGWLEMDHASKYGEWAYRGVKPRILAEELLTRTTQDGLPELRVWCLGGEPRFLRRSYRLAPPSGQRHWMPMSTRDLDTDWNSLPFRSAVCPEADMPERPDYLDEMLAAARALSRGMAFLRIDFTDCGGRLYFGELTVYPNAGGHRWDPPETDLLLGNMLTLPDPASLR